MDSSDQRNKRKNMLVTIISSANLVSPTSLLFLLCFSFLFLFSFFSSHNSFHLSFSTLSLPHSSTPNYIYYPLFSPLPLKLQHAILFPDHVLLMLSNPHHALLPHQLKCLYYNNTMNGSSEVYIQSVLSTSRLDEFRSIVRCPLPEMKFFAMDLHHRDLHASQRNFGCLSNQTVVNYDKLAYEAILDGNTVVVFVKGMNLRPHKLTDPTSFHCHIGLDGDFWLTTKAVSVAQEVVRCLLPQSIIGSKNNTHRQHKVRGLRVTVSHMISHMRHPVREVMPSVARVHHSCSKRNIEEKYELCACTMVWNQARVLKEWVMYHAWLGVERWFIYDNNSDDDIDHLVRELNLKGFNISINTWPWIKTQEAGFSHCALKSKEECKWVAFFDIDEFFYFPRKFNTKNDGENSLRSMVANFSNSNSIAEIRTACHSFGPSGLALTPKRGVTVGYTCRLRYHERHKSIVRPDLLHSSLMNLVHHFQLREGFEFRFMDEGDVVINHYKYQVWEIFKAKFYRRVATYVVDWKEDKTKGSKDRAPGLGTEAIEPPNWRLQFCEVWDNGLKDFLLSNFTNPDTGLMPWE